MACLAGSGRQWAVMWACGFCWLGSGVPVGSLGPRGGVGEGRARRLYLRSVGRRSWWTSLNCDGHDIVLDALRVQGDSLGRRIGG